MTALGEFEPPLLTTGTGLRIAMISAHTSPLAQPGGGDAGGLNVYVTELSRALAALGAQVEIFTRRTSSQQPDVVPLTDGVTVSHITAGPFEGLTKNDLPAQMCYFTAGVLRTEASRRVGWYDLVHSHYWLSGQAGWLAANRWGVPLVHTMHTMARVKNANLAEGDTPEPSVRVIGEEQVVAEANMLIASTAEEAQELVDLYGAAASDVAVVPPGVDLVAFAADHTESVARPVLRDHSAGPSAVAPIRPISLPASGSWNTQAGARDRLGLPHDRKIVVFAGRLQPLKGPDVLVRAWPDVTARFAKPPLLVVIGGPSGRPLARDELRALAWHEGVSANVVFSPPVPQETLADWFRAADLVAVPSHHESFGLVALEAQAVGTPVVATAVGGLTTVVANDTSGILVAGHDPQVWANAIGSLLLDDRRRARLAAGARAQSEQYTWERTARRTLAVYRRALTAGPRR